MSMNYLGEKFKKRVMRKKKSSGKAILKGEEQKRDRMAADSQRLKEN